ncbi:MAG: histidine phosphatase family protein [Leptolyngbyaceae cyanobacterium SM2_5_2]|nr:histidine phosphatase family protein [Leptolyngbyaceae cyanobacterium SM2_5_2]
MLQSRCPRQSQRLPPSPPPELNVAQPAPSSDSAAVWHQLRQADAQLYVVLLRHALAPGTGDPSNFRLGDCGTQRNLSAEGREQARQIGAAFRQQGIPVVKVLSSQWCRCLETAELMDLGPVEPFPALNSFFNDRSTATRQTTEVQTYLRQQPARGVIVMVTHQVNITALTDKVPASGEAVVLRQTAIGELVPVGALDPLN